MSQAIILKNPGTTSTLELQEINLAPLQPNEVRVSQKAIGINNIDFYYKKNLIALPNQAADIILGSEACGYIEELGEKVTGFKIGQRVCYATTKVGAYCTMRNIDTKYLIAVPDTISDEDVASVFYKALVAHYLLRRCFFVKKNDIILMHNASGAIEGLMCQWAKYLEAIVIGTVLNEEEKAVAQKSGFDHIYNYQNFKDEIIKSYPSGIHAVFDGVGSDNLANSALCLQRFGIIVNYDNSFSKISDIETLMQRSVFFTRPSLFDYKDTRMELIASAGEIFEMIEKKRLKIPHYKKYNFNNFPLAHLEIEEKKNYLSAILVC
jgi:NADPH2:quinone reductase